MTYDPRGRTPQGRVEQLAEIRVENELRDRRAADVAHGPAGTADIFARMQHWEERVEQAEAYWDLADRRWRDLVVGYGRWPTALEASEIAGALGERARCSAECSALKATRDEVLREFESIRNPDWR